MSEPSAVPLNHQNLLEVLQAASSSRQNLVLQASAQLKEWEKQTGYWTLLQVRGGPSNKLVLLHALTCCSTVARMPTSTAPSPSSCGGLPSSR